MISSGYGVNLDSRMLEKFCTWLTKRHACTITTVCYIILPKTRYNVRLLPLLRQFPLIPNRTNTFMDLRVKYSAFWFNQFYWDLINTWWLCLFRFLITISSSKALGSATSGSAVCISVCQTSLTLCTLRLWEKLFLNLDKILWKSVTKSPFSSLLYWF